jgi:hypothetical protein
MMKMGSKMVGKESLDWKNGSVKVADHPDALTLETNTEGITTPVSTPRGEDISNSATETDYDSMMFGEEAATEGAASKTKAKEEAKEGAKGEEGDKTNEPKATGYAAALLRKADPPPTPSPKAKPSSPTRRGKDTKDAAHKKDEAKDKKDEADSANSSTGGKRGWESAGARKSKVPIVCPLPH